MFVSNAGEALPICWRLRQEGIDAGIYLHSPQYARNYDGLLAKVTLSQLKKVVKDVDIILFDMSRFNEKTKQDIALLKMFGCKMSAPSVFGSVADKLRKDHKVIGSSAFTEELEFDRKKGIDFARKAGFAIPEMQEFTSLTEGVRFLQGRKDLWVFKPFNNQELDLTYVEQFPGELVAKMSDEWQQRIPDDCQYLLQKKIEGVEVSSEVWVGEKGPRHYNHTIENKRLMTGDLGPATGSQSNTVWLDKTKLCVKPLERAAQRLREGPYVGPCDANCIIAGDKTPYFLEFSPRLGFDAFYCLAALMKGKLSKFFLNDFDVEFDEGYGVSERLSIPPYPYAGTALRKEFARDVRIFGRLKDYPYFWAQDVYSDAGKLRCAGADGILGVVTAYGKDLDTAWGRLAHNVKKVKVAAYRQYRTDGLISARKRIEGLKNA